MSRMEVTRGWVREILVKASKPPVIKQINSGYLMYSMVIILNDSVSYTSKLLKQ